MGSQDNNLHRRHAHSGRDKRGGESTPGSVAVPPGSPRVHCQSREVIPGPNTGTGIPWVVCGLAESPTQTPWREDRTDSQRCNTDPNEGFSVSSTPFTISGQAQRSISCNVSRSLILPSLAEGSPKSSYRREPRLRTWDKAIQRVKRRIGLVATSPHSLEREDSDSEASFDSDLVRCLPNRLGCSVPWCEYRRLMVPTGANNAYQLPGTPGYGIGNENLLEGSSRSLSVTAAGQFLCSSIHQQSWGDCVIISDLSGKISVAVGPRERHCLDSPAYSRGAQQSSRPDRLDAGTRSVPENQSNIRPTGSGPVCLSTHTPATLFLQLETRSPSRNHRCISARLEESERLCQPTMLSNRTCPQQDTGTESSSCFGGSSVERPRLVSSPSGDVEGISTTHSSTGVFAAERGSTESDRNNPSASRVACLRERYRGSNLLTEASKLMLASWRPKSSQSYESHLRKWVRWCTEWGRDPISGPVADVANFWSSFMKKVTNQDH